MKFDMANYTASINANTTAQTQKILDAICQNKIEAQAQRINLQENLTQGDKQDLMQEFDTQTTTILKEIHKHLEVQDNKIDYILKRLEEM